MWRVIGRLILIPLAFIIAILGALTVVVTVGLERLTHEIGSPVQNFEDPDKLFAYWDITVQALALYSGLTVVPALLAIIVGEVARIRSALYYIVAGGISAAAIPFLSEMLNTAQANPGFSNVWPIFATAGFAGGGLYWLIAGRNA